MPRDAWHAGSAQSATWSGPCARHRTTRHCSTGNCSIGSPPAAATGAATTPTGLPLATLLLVASASMAQCLCAPAVHLHGRLGVCKPGSQLFHGNRPLCGDRPQHTAGAAQAPPDGQASLAVCNSQGRSQVHAWCCTGRRPWDSHWHGSTAITSQPHTGQPRSKLQEPKRSGQCAIQGTNMKCILALCVCV